MANTIRRCWDSDCCFGLIANQAGRHEQCERVMLNAQEGKSEIVISSLAIAEVLWMPGQNRLAKDERDVIRKFFERTVFIVADVTRAIAEQAQELVWEHGVRPKDAIHAATALSVGAHYLESFDGGLTGKSRQIGGDPILVIQNPGEDLVRAEAEARRMKPQQDFLSGPFAS